MGKRLLAETSRVFEMKYDIYFHGNCFDGAASAATLSHFLKLRGDSYGKFIPLTHPVNKKWWRKLKMKSPSAVVDITYHPRAKIWFDHHPTTFIDKRWEKDFKASDIKLLTSNFKILDTKSPSCTGLIFRHFTKNFEIKAPKHIKELAKWADIIDRARFKNAREAMGFQQAALRIAKSFVDKKPSLSYAKLLIKALSEKSMIFIDKLKPVRIRFLKHKRDFKKSMPEIKKHLVLRGKVTILYGMNKRLAGARFASYYFYPQSKYSVRILKRGNKHVLSVGQNPWNPPRHPRIGQYLEKKYGGGGHSVAGSAAFTKKNDALREALNIADYLNKHV